MAEYESVYDPKVKRQEPTAKKPPGFICETAFASISLFMLKFYSDAAFDALTFTTVLLPVMAFSRYMRLLKKISSSHKPTHHHPSAKAQSTVNKQKRSSKSAHSFLFILRTPRDTIITFMPVITLLLILAKNFSEPRRLLGK